MKERIQEALRRRHRRGDEGFTLIELLVVILIIAILAAVGIIALLSALNSGRKSSAKTTARQAQSAADSVKVGLGDTDYRRVYDDAIFDTEPNFIKANARTNLRTDLRANQLWIEDDGADIGPPLVPGGGVLQLVTRSQLDNDNHVCYYIQLEGDEPTLYGSERVPEGTDCAATAGTYNREQRIGWDD